MYNLFCKKFSTPLGDMILGATVSHVCLIEFADHKNMDIRLSRLEKKLQATLSETDNPLLFEVEKQLNEYFSGKRQKFTLPLQTSGTQFQELVWQSLQQIPYGQTQSYKQVAQVIRSPKAVRAVAQSNGANGLAIVIPCHRVIGADGTLTGYGGGLWRKQWLLDLEQTHAYN